MKAIPRIWSVTFVLALTGGVLSCSSSAPRVDAVRSVEHRSGPAELEIVIGGLTSTSEEIEGDERIDYALVDVRNELDRSISVDFIGAAHSDLSVGDRRAKRIRLTAGSYTVAVGAPGMTPAKAQILIEAEKVYSLPVFQRR